MKAFLSHISEEAREAEAIKQHLEKAISGLEVFVSSADIHLGDAWLQEIDVALTDTKLILSLCSLNSIRRPWINFECGSGWSRKIPVIPICYKNLRKDDLPDPLGIFQAVELRNAVSCRTLVADVATKFSSPIAPEFDPEVMWQDLQIEEPLRTEEIGIVLCYRQDEWESNGHSVFSFPKFLPENNKEGWQFRRLNDKRMLLSPALHQLSGIILGTPWRSQMEVESISAIVEWVRAGGRLLLLGFELGDRHHNANLAELSHQFGIDPASNIVGPPDFGSQKPYDCPVDFLPSAADQHSLTKGLRLITLTNIQTLRVEPGGTEWLRVGTNAVYVPRRETVQYRDGTMSTPGGSAFRHHSGASRMAVAVQAPRGLCGAGSVHMIGSWDLLGRNQLLGGDNTTLLKHLLNWLSSRSA